MIVLLIIGCVGKWNVFNLPFSEWLVNQHRDSFASYIGHPNLVEFFAIAENESKARVKFNFLQVCIAPALCCLRYRKPNPPFCTMVGLGISTWLYMYNSFHILQSWFLPLFRSIRKCSMYLCSCLAARYLFPHRKCCSPVDYHLRKKKKTNSKMFGFFLSLSLSATTHSSQFIWLMLTRILSCPLIEVLYLTENNDLVPM